MDKRQINNAADALFNSERVQKIAQKYQFRTTAERLAPFRSLFVFSSYLLQVLSALLAAGGVLMLSRTFATSFAIVGGVSVLLLVLLEAAKRLSYDTLNTQRISGEPINKTVVFFCLIFAGCSVVSSKLGAPHTVEFFAVAPAKIDTAAINARFDLNEAAAVAYWQGKAEASLAEAEQIKSDANRRGVLRSLAVAPYTKAKAAAISAQDSLLKYSAIINADRRAAINQATLADVAAFNVFASWRGSFAVWLAWLSVAFEISFFCVLWFLANYDGRLLLEYKAATAAPVKDDIKTRLNTIKDEVKDAIKDTFKDEVKEPVFNSKDGAKIGFNRQDKDEVKDGVIIQPVPPQKLPRVQIEIDGGKVKRYTAGGLKNLIRASKPERAAELIEYLKKLQNYE